MRLVVADTSPIRYLVRIGQIDLLPRLFERIFLPSVVADELHHPSAPPAVRDWMQQPPGWLEVMPVGDIDDPALSALDSGERSAIALGLSLGADLILIDDRKGAVAALSKGLEVTGTLGVLDLAAERGLVDLVDAFDRLKRTNFRYRQELFDVLLKKHRDRGGRA
jgi:predicted nucleic acid-binding protein